MRLSEPTVRLNVICSPMCKEDGPERRGVVGLLM